jgi:hypothetical protein
MKSKLIGGAIGALLLLAAPGTATAAATDCGGIPAHKISRLKATGASCATARKVAKAWDRTGRKVRGFSCGYLPIKPGSHTEKVICRKDSAKITFKKRWVGAIPFPTYPPIQTPVVSAA